METGLNTASVGASVTSATTRKPSNQLDKDAFLKLLVAQLQSQDPTQAQDPNQMVQQMTSYSALEQQQNTNALLQGLQAQNTGIFQAQATSMVGHKIKVIGNQVQLSGGTGVKLDVNLPADATSLKVVFKDAKGNVVATLDQGAKATGSHMITWDGKDATGAPLPEGTYTAEVVALDAKGKSVSPITMTYLRVDAVAFANGTVNLVAGGKTYGLGDIAELSI
jgi:flagellar basal-body rod modification protein FlgD